MLCPTSVVYIAHEDLLAGFDVTTCMHSQTPKRRVVVVASIRHTGVIDATEKRKYADDSPALIGSPHNHPIGEEYGEPLYHGLCSVLEFLALEYLSVRIGSALIPVPLTDSRARLTVQMGCVAVQLVELLYFILR